MAYNKTTWENAPSTNSPINASNLNKIEEGIYQNSLKADQVGDLSNLETVDKTSVVNAINSMRGKILWTNSSTTSSFAPQTISLTNNDCDMIEIFYYAHVNQQQLNSTKIPLGETGLLQTIFQYSNKGFIGSRPVKYTNTSEIEIYDCYSTVVNDTLSRNLSNTWTIPLYIIGYKTGLFNV
jgi:hypothetical protein